MTLGTQAGTCATESYSVGSGSCSEAHAKQFTRARPARGLRPAAYRPRGVLASRLPATCSGPCLPQVLDLSHEGWSSHASGETTPCSRAMSGSCQRLTIASKSPSEVSLSSRMRKDREVEMAASVTQLPVSLASATDGYAAAACCGYAAKAPGSENARPSSAVKRAASQPTVREPVFVKIDGYVSERKIRPRSAQLLSRVSCMNSTLRSIEVKPRPKSAVDFSRGERYSGVAVTDPEYIWDVIPVSRALAASRRERKLTEERRKTNCMV